MKFTTVTSFGSVLVLAACGNQPNASSAPQASATMAAPKTASGEGTITAIDATTGKISLSHGPIAELNWPAMTMGFNAGTTQTKGLRIGDKVRFTFRWDGKTAEIETIDKIG
ncbi:copper-binding protein [Sphingomonas sp. GlSt437]|uniref:copper-binding protein n=1 Tax=Sphingomonas sp. GlSt437 TaxID=3389970 RepID=UPI003A8AABC0